MARIDEERIIQFLIRSLITLYILHVIKIGYLHTNKRDFA